MKSSTDSVAYPFLGVSVGEGLSSHYSWWSQDAHLHCTPLSCGSVRCGTENSGFSSTVINFAPFSIPFSSSFIFIQCLIGKTVLFCATEFFSIFSILHINDLPLTVTVDRKLSTRNIPLLLQDTRERYFISRPFRSPGKSQMNLFLFSRSKRRQAMVKYEWNSTNTQRDTSE